MARIPGPDRQQLHGAFYGLAAAALFGVSTPVAKRLLVDTGPLVMASLLYLGAGLALSVVALLPRLAPGSRARQRETPLRRMDAGLLLGIVLTGGILGPVLMLIGLGRVSGVVGSLLLNLEAPMTILLALVIFREHLGRRAAWSGGLILMGAAVLSYQPGDIRADPLGVLAITAACLSWGIDNNLTQRLSLRDPIRVVQIKALGAGLGMLGVVAMTGQPLPPMAILLPVLLLGAVSYGLSIVLDVYALRLLGAAREAAFFATAPFLGALASVPLLGESLGADDLLGMTTMAVGVGLLLRDRHSHVHVHDALEHEHVHVHDEHHQHAHPGAVEEPHAHWHRHAPLTHEHPHVSDLHHRHPH